MKKRKNNKFILAALVASIMTCGCAQQAIVAAPESAILKSISESAETIHGDITQLSRVKDLTDHRSHSFMPRPTPKYGTLAKRLTIKWVGRPEDAVKAIAMMAGMPSPKVIGKIPAGQSMVLVDAKNRPVAEILEDIGLQMGDKAGISFDSSQITVIYEGAHE